MHGACSVIRATFIISVYCFRLNSGWVHHGRSTPPTVSTITMIPLEGSITYEPQPPVQFWSPITTKSKMKTEVRGHGNDTRRISDLNKSSITSEGKETAEMRRHKDYSRQQYFKKSPSTTESEETTEVRGRRANTKLYLKKSPRSTESEETSELRERERNSRQKYIKKKGHLKKDKKKSKPRSQVTSRKWPKVKAEHHPKALRKRKEILRSTKLEPAQLAQNEKSTSPPLYLTTEIEAKEKLNPYFLQGDLIKLMSTIPNANVTFEVIGRTIEYNDIVLCKMTERKSKYFRANDDKYVEEEPEKKIIFIVHGLSAMGFRTIPGLYEKGEFIKLVKFYAAYLDKFDIYLIPLANPDGISDITLEMWNKNRSPQSACPGVALDRNFDVAWNTSHVSSCSPHYPGPSPFSEPESRAVSDVLHQYSHKIIAYIHVHAGACGPDVFKGDAVLYPKGFTHVTSEDDNYIDIKGEIDEALKIAGFKVMSVTVDTLYNWYGRVFGTSVDYASSIYGVPYAMEFVMQPYQPDPHFITDVFLSMQENLSGHILQEIWRRVIDVVFTNIYKSTHPTDGP